jgi:hypothetical protein
MVAAGRGLRTRVACDVGHGVRFRGNLPRATLVFIGGGTHDMDDGGIRRVGSTFRWLEGYPASHAGRGWQDVAFAAIVIALAAGSAMLLMLGHEVHTVAAQLLGGARG